MDNCLKKMNKTKITRNGRSFNVAGSYSSRWFSNSFPKWEASTFKVLERYGGDGGVYLDVGAWIGPTVLYSAHLFDHVIALDADPVALERLDMNIAANDFDNITVVKKALGNVNAKSVMFGGNGPLGNSMSTLLVSDPEYANLGKKLVSARSEHIKMRHRGRRTIGCTGHGSFPSKIQNTTVHQPPPVFSEKGAGEIYCRSAF